MTDNCEISSENHGIWHWENWFFVCFVDNARNSGEGRKTRLGNMQCESGNKGSLLRGRGILTDVRAFSSHHFIKAILTIHLPNMIEFDDLLMNSLDSNSPRSHISMTRNRS